MMNRHRIYLTLATLTILAILVASCGFVGNEQSTSQTATPSAGQPLATSEARVTEVPRTNWSQLLSRDAIQPIYDPQFVSAQEADYSDNELVMGVAIDGEAKAYPVGLLNSREMVNDELAGIPFLVTW